MVKKGKAPNRVHTTRSTPNKTAGVDNTWLMVGGGVLALAGLGFGAYFWMSSLQAAQQAQQQINAAAKPAQATANAQAVGGGGLFPAILPGTALITAGAVNPLGAFHTLFPVFGGAQVFTLTRRSCDPVIGGVPTQSDLASQGIVITSYQVNNVGLPGPPGVCGIPKMSITVGTTDPSSAIKLQALGFVPGTWGGSLQGGFGGFVAPWSRPMLPTVFPPPFGPTVPIGGYPGNIPPIFPGVIPPYPPRPIPPGLPIPLPAPKAPWWYPYRFPARKKARHGHKGKKGHEPVHIIGIPKHNFVRPIGHVLNFDRH